MYKMLCIAVLALAVSCKETTRPEPARWIRFEGGQNSFVKREGVPAAVSYASQNCDQVLVVSTTGVYQGAGKVILASGSLDLSSVQPQSVVTLYCTAGSQRVASASLSVVGAGFMAIDRNKTATTVVLNTELSVVLNQQNIETCNYEFFWPKTGKEEPNSILPKFADANGSCTPTFAPGSTMPKGIRSVLLTVRALGYDGRGIIDTMTVQLLVPKLEVCGISRDSVPSGKWVGINFTGCGRKTFVSTNGVDFKGTLSGFGPVGYPVPYPGDPALVTNYTSFQNPELYGAAANFGSGVYWDYYNIVYIANDGRPEPAIGFPVKVYKP